MKKRQALMSLRYGNEQARRFLTFSMLRLACLFWTGAPVAPLLRGDCEKPLITHSMP